MAELTLTPSELAFEQDKERAKFGRILTENERSYEAERSLRGGATITSNSDDVSTDFVVQNNNSARSSSVGDMEEWLETVNAGGQPPVAPSGVVDGPQTAPTAKPLVRKTDDSLGRLSGEESSAGAIMRNIAEVVPAASKGVNDAVMNATSFLSPLANWLDENVVDLSIDGVFEDPKTPTGMITKGISQFLTGFIPVMKAMKSSGMITNTFKAGTGAGAIADLAVWNGQEGRLADVWNSAGLPKNILTDFLASDPGDSATEARAKTALEGAGFGGVLVGGIMLAAKAMRAIRPVGKAVKDEQKALEAKYGTMTDEEQKQFLGDPDALPVEIVPKAQPPGLQAHRVAGKIEAGAEATEKLAPGAVIRGKGQKVVPGQAAEMNDSGNLPMSQYFRSEDLGTPGGVISKIEELGDKAPIVKVDPKKVYATQTHVEDGGRGTDMGAVMPGFEDHPVLARTPNGELHIVDGHHRIEAALKSKKQIKAYVVDITDAKASHRPKAAPQQIGGELPDTLKIADEFEASTGKSRTDYNNAENQIESAILADANNKFIVRGADGKIKGAIAFSDEAGPDDLIDIAHVGSVEHGAGTKLMKLAVDFAASKGKGIGLFPSEKAIGFYEKLGFKHTDQKIMVMDAAGVKELAAKLNREPRGAVKGVRGSILPEYFEVKINFAHIDAPEQVKFTIGKMAEAMKGHIDEARRGVITQEETAKLATDLGMSVPDLLARRKGQAFNAEEALAARNLWAASGTKLLELAKAAARKNAGPLDQFAFRRAMAVHAAIQAEVLGARAEMGRGLASWSIKSKGKTEQLRAIEQIMQASGGTEASSEMARRLSILAEEGASPAAIGRFAQRGWGAKSMDAVKEVWINGLLSNPVTHAVNIMSNTLVAFQSIYERLAAAGIRQFLGGVGSEGGEATAMAFGMVESLKDAFRMAAKTLRTGETGHEFHKIDLNVNRALSSEAFNMSRETGLGRAVDFIGSIIRVPGRLLATEDEFFKAIGYRMEVHAQALRQASQEGHQGKDLAKRVQELADDPPEFIRVNSADAALYRTFTSDMGAFGKAVMNLRNIDHPLNPLPFILPFLRTPVNIARYAFERTPFAPLVAQWRDDIAAGGARADLALAKMATGTAIMTVALDLADSGVISGQGPVTHDRDVREAMLRQGWQPYSIKVGDRWYSYNRADPFGMTIGFAASIAETVRRGEIDEEDVDEWNEVTAMSIAAVAQVSISKTYLQGFAKFIEVMSDPQRHSQRYVSDLMASFLPFTALSSSVKNVVDPVMRETGSPAEAVYARIAGLSEQLPPRRNLWGEPLTSSSGLGKLYDFTSPIKSKAQVESPIDRELVRLDAGPLRISKKTSFDGVPVNMKQFPLAYDDYVRLAGNDFKSAAHGGMGAKDYLSEVVSGKHPMSIVYNMGSDESRRDFIRSTISDYRQYAQQQVLADPKHAAFAAQVQAAKDYDFSTKMPVLE